MQLDLRDSLTILVRSNVACFCKYIVYPSKAKEKLFPIIQHYQKYPCVSIFVTDRKVIPKMLISIFDNKRRAIFFPYLRGRDKKKVTSICFVDIIIIGLL
jgi:hypothetical protein